MPNTKKEKEYRRSKLSAQKSVISLRLNDYASQSGRLKTGSSAEEEENTLFKLSSVINEFIKTKEQKILTHKDKFITKQQYLKLSGLSESQLSKKISAVKNYHTLVLKGNLKPNGMPAVAFFSLVKFFLDEKEKEFGISYKFNFYKDVYKLNDDKLLLPLAGIYKLERLSSLNNKQNFLSVSKLEIKECIDPEAKNVFNDFGRTRYSFVETKFSEDETDGATYNSVNIGRIVIRNHKNLFFMGVAEHTPMNGKVEKNIQIMSLRKFEKGLFLKGISLDATGPSKYYPFAARVRAEYVAKDNVELLSKELASDFFNARKLREEDTFFTEENPSISELNGILTAF